MKAIKQIRVGKKTQFLVFLTCLLVAGYATISYRTVRAANPAIISFQGKVVNADGTNVTNGSYNFDFVLYDDLTLGTPSDGVHDKWHELTKSVTITNGVFQTNLGSATALPDFNTNNSLYLAVRFNADAAGYMSPRVQMASVPYALNADKVGGVAASSIVQLGASQSGNINIGSGTLTSGLINGQTISTSANFTGTLAVQGASVTVGAAAQAGSLVLYDSDSGSETVSLLGGAIGSSYSLTLPTAAGGTSQCLQTDSVTASQLVFSSCGAGSGANTALSNLASVAINTALLPGADNTIDLGSASFSFRTLYADTSVLSPLVDTAATLSLGTGTATTVTIGGTNATALNFGDAVATKAIKIGGVTNSGTDTVSIATNATAADIISIGSSHASSTTLLTGGASSLNLVNASATLVGTTVNLNGATVATNATTLTLFDTTTTNATAFSALTGTLNIADAATTKSIEIGGVTNSGTDTVSIATNATAADIISIGSSHASSTTLLTGGNSSLNLINGTSTLTGTTNTIAGTTINLNAATVATNATTLTLFDTTATNATAFSAITGTLNIGDAATTKTIEIGGVTNSGTDTVRIATNATAADIISIGSSHASSTALFTGGGGSLALNNTTATLQSADSIVLNSGGANARLSINSSGEIGIGTAAVAGTHLTSSYSVSGGSNATGFKLNVSQTAAAVMTLVGSDFTANATHTSGTVTGIVSISAQTRPSGNGGTTTTVTGIDTWSVVGTGHTVTTVNGILVNGPSVSGTAGTINGIKITNPSGTITTNYGINIQNMTAGATNNYGIYVAGASTYALWVDSGTARFDDNVIYSQSAGSNFQITATAVPTVDQIAITNAGQGVTTAGVEGLNINYVGGAAAVESSGARIDLTPGGTTGGTWSGLRIVANATGATTGVTEYGVKIEGPTTPGAGTETGLYIGTGWDTGLNVQSGGINLAGYTSAGSPSDPPAPAADNLSVYAKKVAGRMMLKWKAPSGVDTSLQPNLGFNTICLWAPATGTTAVGTGFGTTWPAVTGTITHPTVANTDIGATIKAMQATNVVTTQNQILGLTSSTATLANVYMGNAAGRGGFFMQTRFKTILVPATTIRLFVGLTSMTTGASAADTVTGDTAGLSHITTDNITTMAFITRDNTTTTRATFTVPTIAAGNTYDFTMYAAPNGSTIFYRLVDLLTGTVVVDSSTSTTIPRNTIFMGPQVQMSNGTANTTVTTTAIGINKIYLESDN